MKLDAALKRLERRSRPALRCAWCLYSLTDISPAKQEKYRREPASAYRFVCRWCGTDYMADLSGMSERQREAYIISHEPPFGAIYRDERVYAADTWFNSSRALQWWREGGDPAELERARRQAFGGRDKKHMSGEARRRAEVRERAFTFAREMEKWEREKYGPHSFALAAEVKGLESLQPDRFGFIPGTYKKMEAEESRARHCLHLARVMEACERVLWGAAVPETVTVIAEYGSVIHGFEDERARQAREEEERKRLEEEERRRRDEERRARLAPHEPPRVGYGGDWLRQDAPETEAQPARVQFKTQAAAEPPLTPTELRRRTIERCGGFEQLERANEMIFTSAQEMCDVERMMNLAHISEEERRRRGFSWNDGDGSVMTVIVPSVR